MLQRGEEGESRTFAEFQFRAWNTGSFVHMVVPSTVSRPVAGVPSATCPSQGTEAQEVAGVEASSVAGQRLRAGLPPCGGAGTEPTSSSRVRSKPVPITPGIAASPQGADSTSV